MFGALRLRSRADHRTLSFCTPLQLRRLPPTLLNKEAKTMNDGGVPLKNLPDKMPLALAGPNRHASFGFLH